ncbi:DNA polymerase III subunit alpha [bacterium LRH843]|nr:DNA polymerase III subunit alpha [bacterium LRH843]
MIVQTYVYSEYSLLSSINRIEALVKKAKEFGYQALALSDHHVMYGAVPFYKACLKHKIKPIFGLELTIGHDESSIALVRLYAKNEQGYAHLLKLATLIGHKNEKQSYLTRDEVTPYLNELVIIFPYERGPIHPWLLNGQEEKALSWLETWRKVSEASDWYLEVKGMGEKDENESIHSFSKRNGMNVIAAQPCYFLEKTDADAFQVARAIRDGVSATDRPLTTRERSYYLQSPEQMVERYYHEREALENTKQFAIKCSVALTLGKLQLPQYDSGNHLHSEEQLRELCEEGARFRYGELTEAVNQRLDKELSVISRMGFNDYFLIVWDFMRYARRQGMLTGPGRGSAAGSLVAYVLQITNIDPLKYNLLFERFLNHERVSMPDIDIDFPDHRRDEVIEYVQKKYGSEHVAQIMTFGTLAAKAVIRDVGKALGLKNFTIEQVAKEIPSGHGVTLEKAVSENNQLKTIIAQSEETKRLWEIAKQLEGLPKHVSTHAAGVVISSKPLPEIVALQAGQSAISLTQAPMNVIEDLGLLKFDFLGLKNLTLLEHMLALIWKHDRVKLDLAKLPLDDEKTFQLLASGNTTGVFQLESKGMRRVLVDLGPSEFEDIVAVNALYRPGPMNFIQTYIEGKHKSRTTTYVHPDLESVLKRTYGVIIYQEQIMQIASLLGGFTLAEADTLRRAISKKNKLDLEKQKEAFIEGAMKKGYDMHVSTKVFSLIERFADYGFNRSHAVAYSMISYQLAYIKAHYPLVFYTALFSSVLHNHDKLYHHLQECRKEGYDILPPSISKSELLFTIEEGAIRFGLLAINHVGVHAAEAIIKERKVKPINDLFSFAVRFNLKTVNKKTIEQLIKAGAMDEFGEDRATLLFSIDVAMEFASTVKQFQEETAGLFTLDVETPGYEQAEPLFIHEKLELEKEAFGFYLSGHPIESYEAKLAAVGRTPIHDAILQYSYLRIAGLVTQVRMIKTKKGDRMAFALLSDESGEVELVFFPNVMNNVQDLLVDGELILLEGKMDKSRGREQFIVAKGIHVKALGNKKVKQEDRLYLRVIQELADQFYLREKLLAHKGSVPVILYFEQTKKTKRLPAKYAVDPNDTCLRALREILGSENVVLRKREELY